IMKSANRSRAITPVYQVGDYVWLSTKNLQTARRSWKLDHKMIGLYKVAARVGPNSYRLNLLENIQTYNMFYTSLLQIAPEDLLLGQRHPEPSLVVIDR